MAGITNRIGKFLLWIFGIGMAMSIIGHLSGGGGSPTSASQPAANASQSHQAADPEYTRAPAKAVATLKKTTDKVEKVDFYQDKASPSIRASNAVYAYIGDDGKNSWLRLVFQYTGENWLFIQKAIIVVNGEKLAEATGHWERDNSSRVWEWLDMKVDKPTLAVIKAMAGSNDVVVRYEGRQYIKDRKLSSAELAALRHVLAAYQELGGN